MYLPVEEVKKLVKFNYEKIDANIKEELDNDEFYNEVPNIDFRIDNKEQIMYAFLYKEGMFILITPEYYNKNKDNIEEVKLKENLHGTDES